MLSNPKCLYYVRKYAFYAHKTKNFQSKTKNFKISFRVTNKYKKTINIMNQQQSMYLTN